MQRFSYNQFLFLQIYAQSKSVAFIFFSFLFQQCLFSAVILCPLCRSDSLLCLSPSQLPHT